MLYQMTYPARAQIKHFREIIFKYQMETTFSISEEGRRERRNGGGGGEEIDFCLGFICKNTNI